MCRKLEYVVCKSFERLVQSTPGKNKRQENKMNGNITIQSVLNRQQKIQEK